METKEIDLSASGTASVTISADDGMVQIKTAYLDEEVTPEEAVKIGEALIEAGKAEVATV